MQHRYTCRPMLYNCLEWYKWVLTNLYHERQLYLHTYSTVARVASGIGLRISRLNGSVELTLRYTTPDMHCRHRRHECDGGIKYEIIYTHLNRQHTVSSDKYSAVKLPFFWAYQRTNELLVVIDIRCIRRTTWDLSPVSSEMIVFERTVRKNYRNRT